MIRQDYTIYDIVIFVIYLVPASLHTGYFWGRLASRMGRGIYAFRHRRRNDDQPDVSAADGVPF